MFGFVHWKSIINYYYICVYIDNFDVLWLQDKEILIWKDNSLSNSYSKKPMIQILILLVSLITKTKYSNEWVGM